MKKPKFNLGEGGWKGFLLLHVEKLVLVVVGILVAVFVYSGYQREGYTKGDPADMKRKADETIRYVAQQDHSINRITKEKRNVIEDYPTLVDKSRRAIPASDYAVPILDPPRFPPTRLRQDPQLFAAEKVEAEGFLVAVYEYPEDEDDPYKNDKAGILKKKASDKKKAAAKKDPGPAMPGMPGMPAMPGMEKGPKGGGKSGKSSSGKNAGKNAGGSGAMPAMPGMPGMPGGEGDDSDFGAMPGGMSGMPGMAGGMSGASVSEQYIERYVNGFRPGGSSAPGMMGQPGNAGQEGGVPRGVSRYVVAVKAVMPHKKIWDEYQRVLAEAQGYEPARDLPNYVYFYVERAEVGDDPNAPPQWKRLKTRDAQIRMESWAGSMPEVADMRYLDPILTQNVPPAMMVDPARLAMHSEVPRASAAIDPQAVPGAVRPKRGVGTGDDEGDLPGSDLPGASGFGADGGAPGMPGMPGMPGGMPGRAAPGMPGMPGGMPGRGAPGMPGMPGGQRPPGSGSGAPRMGSGGMMPGAGSAPGMPGMPGMSGMMGGMEGIPADVSKYKLIRFFDFDVDPAKKYRYRVQVLVEDPNHPRELDFSPDPRSLSTAVAQRVKQADEADAQKNSRTFWRETDWSEPSDVVSLPSPERFVGGEVLAGRSINIPDQKIIVPIDEPSATVLPVIWDVQRAVEVPGYADFPDDPKKDVEKPTAYRGTVMTFRKDAKVLRPDTLEIKLIEKHDFKVGATVVDLRPSEPVRDGVRKPGEAKEPLKSSGEILILDRHGQLVVRSELEDDEELRRLLFRGEEKEAPGAAGGDMPGMSGMPGGMPPGSTPPGSMPPGGSPAGGSSSGGKRSR